MNKIKFEELPATIQSVYSSRKKDCLCYARVDAKGREFYYVKLDNETDKWRRENGRWTYQQG